MSNKQKVYSVRNAMFVRNWWFAAIIKMFLTRIVVVQTKVVKAKKKICTTQGWQACVNGRQQHLSIISRKVWPIKTRNNWSFNSFLFQKDKPYFASDLVYYNHWLKFTKSSRYTYGNHIKLKMRNLNRKIGSWKRYSCVNYYLFATNDICPLYKKHLPT